ncbi:complement C1q tumor necrosis factor-related protein 3-like [Mya arenaria]|uniref:complement C1q tumor necrosis factor-related protein 3-like n=1 Tax=Mya arenaria TaxID=6604 RepID=UPI0022E2CEFB|nr:complement C1q tumor necrosis factor-related protein 3-like [Mya arenaria]
MSVKFTLLLAFAFSTCTQDCFGLLDETAQQTVESLALDIQQLTERLERLENEKHSESGPVAFTAYLSTNMGTVSPHQHIIFDNVITNVGGSYNALQGHFTAPVRGVYVFHVMITSLMGHSASVQLLHNGNWIGHVLADDLPSSHETSTLSVSVQLEKSDQIWVQNEYAYSGVESIDGNRWSSFVGYLVKAN